jgi:hypothetical protein
VPDLARDVAREHDDGGLAAAYGAGAAGVGVRPADEAVVTIDLARRSIIPGRKVFKVRNVAVRLPSTVECQSFSVSACSGPGRAVPLRAKAATISTPPNSDSMRSRTWEVASRLVASARQADRAATRCSDRFDRVIDRVVVAGDDADARAVVGQPGGRRQADAAGAAGDYGDLAFQVGITAHVLHLRFESRGNNRTT